MVNGARLSFTWPYLHAVSVRIIFNGTCALWGGLTLSPQRPSAPLPPTRPLAQRASIQLRGIRPSHHAPIQERGHKILTLELTRRVQARRQFCCCIFPVRLPPVP